MKDCWVCREKAQWQQEKLLAVKLEAKEKAQAENETMAIIKEGCIYKIYPASAIPAGSTPTEFISKY